MLDDHRFADLVRHRSGLTLSGDRLLQFLRRIGYSDMDTAYAQFAPQPMNNPVWQRFLREISIGETYFFRDLDPVLDAVEMIRQKNADPRPLRAWSAGCSSGEEAYTLAMVLGDKFPGWQINVVGTDINEYALMTARRALYGMWSLRMPGTLVRGGFDEVGDRWQVADPVRRLVSFRVLNLSLEELAYPTADLIVCRNVLMYLATDVRARVRTRLHHALAPGGVLVVDGEILTRDQPPRHSEPAVRHPLPEAPPLPAATSAQGWLDQLQPPPDDPVIYDRARRAADQLDWEGALHILDGASSLDLACAWLRALVLLQQGRDDDALRALRHCLYLDHRFALGHFTLGNLYATRGELSKARRQWDNVETLLADLRPDQPLALGDGITVGKVLAAIRQPEGN